MRCAIFPCWPVKGVPGLMLRPPAQLQLGGDTRGRQGKVTIGLGIGASGGSQLRTCCCAVAACSVSCAVAASAATHASASCTHSGTPSGHTAWLAWIAIAASLSGSCPAACHASRHAAIDPGAAPALLAPLENGASKLHNASRVITSRSITVPPLPASSAATSAFCATTSGLSIHPFLLCLQGLPRKACCAYQKSSTRCCATTTSRGQNRIILHLYLQLITYTYSMMLANYTEYCAILVPCAMHDLE